MQLTVTTQMVVVVLFPSLGEIRNSHIECRYGRNSAIRELSELVVKVVGFREWLNLILPNLMVPCAN